MWGWVWGLLCLRVSGEIYKGDDNILVLDDSNYKAVMDSHPVLLIKFYAPWCGHCKKLAPEFSGAAKILQKDFGDVPLLAKVDATVEQRLSDVYDIEGYPKLKLFRFGRMLEYEGKRTADEMAAFMKKTKRDSSCAAIADEGAAEEFTKISADQDAKVVGFFDDPDCQSHQCIAFAKTAPSHREIPCAIATSMPPTKYGFTSPAVVMFTSFGDPIAMPLLETYPGKSRKARKKAMQTYRSAMSNFMIYSSMPAVIDFSNKEMRKFLGAGRVKFFGAQLMLVVDGESAEKAEAIAAQKKAAEANRPRIINVLVDASKKESRSVLKFLDITSKTKLPVATIIRVDSNEPAKSRKYPFSESPVTAEALASFTQDYFDGKVKPILKSAPLPKPPSPADPVVSLVATSFELMASGGAVKIGGCPFVLPCDVGPAGSTRHAPTDILVEFYEPKCKYCQEFAPKYKALAQRLSSVPSLVVSKMDITVNDMHHPQITMKSYPAIFLFPAHNRANPVAYQGAREEEPLLEWIKAEAQEQFQLDGATYGGGPGRKKKKTSQARMDSLI